MHAAGHEIVARAFGRGTREHRRFDFDEAQLVHGSADFENHGVAQRQIAMRLRAAQIEIAVAQTRLFGRIGFVFDLKRRRLGVVENVQFGGDELDLTTSELGIRLLALDDFAFDSDDVFTANVLGFGVRLGLRLFVKDYLDDAGAVADVEEEEIAEVAATRDPAHDDGVAVGVRGAECAAVVCAFKIAEKIEHGFGGPRRVRCLSIVRWAGRWLKFLGSLCVPGVDGLTRVEVGYKTRTLEAEGCGTWRRARQPCLSLYVGILRRSSFGSSQDDKLQS